jgi:lipoprotein-releasing system permease protein
MFSWLGFERRVATRFMIEGRTQSLLILVGVAAGVAVIAYISALMASVQLNLIDKTLGAQAHVTLSALEDVVIPARQVVQAAGESDERTPAMAQSQGQILTQTQPRAQRPRSPENWRLLVPLLEATPGVAAVSPIVSAGGLAVRGEVSKSIAVSGVDLNRYDRIVRLRSKIVAGEARLGPGEGMIGRELAEDLGVRVGDRLNITVGTISDSLRVTALLDYGVRDLNRRAVIVPLRTAQSLVNLPGGATSLELSLVDLWAAPDYAEDFAKRWAYKVESWQDANPQLVSALTAQSVSTAIIRGVVMIVVVLGISSVLVVSVVQKRREIGILRAMGATRAQVMRIFLLQGAIVGALGSALGIALAWLMIWAFVAFVHGDDGLPLFAITFPPRLALIVSAIATACGVLAAVAPARRAAKLDPAQAIRI